MRLEHIREADCEGLVVMASQADLDHSNHGGARCAEVEEGR